MLHSICDKQPELRQASSYGVGVMAQFGGEGFGPAIQGTISQFLNFQCVNVSLHSKFQRKNYLWVLPLIQGRIVHGILLSTSTKYCQLQVEYSEPKETSRHKCLSFIIVEAIPLLIKVIQDPESRSVENLSATENCISAVTKACKYNPAGTINITEVLPHWLSWLPTWEDEDEAEHIYNYLCDLVEGLVVYVLNKID